MSPSPSERWFRVISPSVVSEIIDGEAVIMDLRSGHYFSTRDTGALIWNWLDTGFSDLQAASQLAMACEIDIAVATDAVSDFVAAILAKDLVQASEARRVEGAQVPTAPLAFTPPRLEAFTDMQDLLLLDPIHDVDDVGWPIRRDDTRE